MGAEIISVALTTINDDFSNQQKWVQIDITFVAIVASLLGIIIRSWMIDSFGSKKTLQTVNVFYILGSITTDVACSPSIIAIGRFMSGMSGVLTNCTPTLHRRNFVWKLRAQNCGELFTNNGWSPLIVHCQYACVVQPQGIMPS